MSQNIEKLHADFLEDLEIGQGRSPKTVENYDRYLRRFYRQENVSRISDISSDAIRSFRRWLNERAPRPGSIADAGVSLATSNYHLIALRQFLRYLAKRDIKALPPDKVGLAKLPERNIDVLYPEEIDVLLEAPGAQSKNGQKISQAKLLSVLRDKSILEVLFSTGMRVAEAVRLNRDYVLPYAREAKSEQEVVEFPIRGKGGKVRVVFLSPSARTALAAYLSKREDIDPALFVQHSPNAAGIAADSPAGSERGLRLTARSIQRLIKKHAAAAGLTKKITPHTLRHTFATDLLSNGADVRQVQQLLGHSSITTTQVYTHLTDVQLKGAHERFHRSRRKPIR